METTVAQLLYIRYGHGTLYFYLQGMFAFKIIFMLKSDYKDLRLWSKKQQSQI